MVVIADTEVCIHANQSNMRTIRIIERLLFVITMTLISLQASAQNSTTYGTDALANNYGFSYSAFGHSAPKFYTGGFGNTAVGLQALGNNQRGSNNTAADNELLEKIEGLTPDLIEQNERNEAHTKEINALKAKVTTITSRKSRK